ncbi:hypothetical protein F511_25023 [Dorcoceras hygrometricum]|uniref:Uncharacterized protein n=1 Tax=Dorcoceras hygrometricum TaxID=472368 RepID=A0A2Z7B798_9LAMI|nr:hypothetical protein F511_25023 [Dorcoceras hygrometricum]
MEGDKIARGWGPRDMNQIRRGAIPQVLENYEQREVHQISAEPSSYVYPSSKQKGFTRRL